MGPVTVDANRLRNLEAARNLEWMVANGRGGFAMCSAPNILTRRYHGLLVAAIKPPLDRWVLLAKLEAAAIIGEQRYELSSNDYPSIVHPAGYQTLESFAPSPNPTWRFRPTADVLIEQTLFIPAGHDTTYLQFRLLEGPATIDFEVRPLCTSRFMHDMAERPDLGEPQLDATRGGFALRWNGRPALHLDSNGQFSALPDWYYQFVLTAEACAPASRIGRTFSCPAPFARHCNAVTPQAWLSSHRPRRSHGPAGRPCASERPSSECSPRCRAAPTTR